MDTLYHILNIERNKFIAFNKYLSTQKNMPSVIFLHGLMSHMNSTKSLFLANYCKKADYNFITFDNFGHGNSSGNFIEETIGSWLNGLEIVLERLADQPTILVGSSMGAWLAILAAMKFPNKITSLICLASAVDFTEESIWKNLTKSQKKQMEQEKHLEITGTNCNDKYPISYQLILEARNHLLLNLDTIALSAPIHLIHGMKDVDVPYNISTQLVEKITSDMVVIKLIKNGDHRLARQDELSIITNSLEELILVK